MKTKISTLKHWEALPFPRKWRMMGNPGDKNNGGNKMILEAIWKEWISTHPLDGD